MKKEKLENKDQPDLRALRVKKEKPVSRVLEEKKVNLENKDLKDRRDLKEKKENQVTVYRQVVALGKFL